VRAVPIRTENEVQKFAATPARAQRPFFTSVLGLRWLDTALDFPIDPLSRHPKLRQAGALQDTLMATKRLGQLRNLG
jgi:hypothetical protein